MNTDTVLSLLNDCQNSRLRFIRPQLSRDFVDTLDSNNKMMIAKSLMYITELDNGEYNEKILTFARRTISDFDKLPLLDQNEIFIEELGNRTDEEQEVIQSILEKN